MIRQLNEHERSMLVSGNEQDVKVATALIVNKDILRKGPYTYENKDFWEKQMRLGTIRRIQECYPHMIITGSVALFLHGLRLERWKYPNNSIDFDLISPYYTLMEDTSDIKFVRGGKHGSGTDFDEFMYITHNQVQTKIDIKVMNTREYEFITYNNYRYKVAIPEDIFEAKLKYAKEGNGKHKNDIREMMGYNAYRESLEDETKVQ